MTASPTFGHTGRIYSGVVEPGSLWIQGHQVQVMVRLYSALLKIGICMLNGKILQLPCSQIAGGRQNLPLEKLTNPRDEMYTYSWLWPTSDLQGLYSVTMQLDDN